MNLFISNLSFKMTDDSLRELFEEFGAVASATVIMDKQTQRSKGFGFVEMLNDNEAQAAISNLHGQQVQGRNLVVNEARPRS